MTKNSANTVVFFWYELLQQNGLAIAVRRTDGRSLVTFMYAGATKMTGREQNRSDCRPVTLTPQVLRGRVSLLIPAEVRGDGSRGMETRCA